ncbi:MAG: hypothetical protein H7Y03_11990, partial [Chitinophagaceae bacterium]|nr:hypothetical protein [Chitinophagaceae bacterium]
FSHILFQVRSRSLKEFEIDGDERVNTLTVAEKEVVFRTNLSAGDGMQDPNKPSEAIIQRFPVTYVGMQLGLAYRF